MKYKAVWCWFICHRCRAQAMHHASPGWNLFYYFNNVYFVNHVYRRCYIVLYIDQLVCFTCCVFIKKIMATSFLDSIRIYHVYMYAMPMHDTRNKRPTRWRGVQCHRRLHRYLSKWQPPGRPTITISSTSRHYEIDCAWFCHWDSTKYIPVKLWFKHKQLLLTYKHTVDISSALNEHI